MSTLKNLKKKASIQYSAFHDLICLKARSYVSKLVARERKARNIHRRCEHSQARVRTGGEYYSIVLYLDKFCPTLSTTTLTVLTLVGVSILIGKFLARVLLHTHYTSCTLFSIKYSRLDVSI